MKRRVTSHDVAKAAGVSQSAVSLVLNGHANARIPDATRERVFAAARELNYRRNSVARTLVTGRTQRIGLVAAHPYTLLNPQNYYREILRGMMSSVIQADYNLMFHSAKYPNDHALCEDILSGGTDGVLLIGRQTADPLTETLLEAGFPVVCVSYIPEAPTAYAVDCDNETGGYLAAKHLLELGHRQIGLFHDSRRYSWERERRAGIERALRESGYAAVVLQPFELAKFPDADAVIHEIVARRRAANPLPAMIFNDETLPQQVAEALPAFGVSVPKDFSLVSFNSTDASERTRPPLTSVYQPISEIAAAAAALLVELIEGREPEPGVRRFPVRLDVRDSTGPV